MTEITGTFTEGNRGPICRRPSDGGAWIVPARGVVVKLGLEYILGVTNQTQAGNLRFAQILGTVEERNRRLSEQYLTGIKVALEDETRITAKYHAVDEFIVITVEGKEFRFVRVGRVGEGYQRNWLRGPQWLPLLPLTDAARAALAAAYEVHKADQEREQKERAVREEQRRLQAEERRKNKDAERLEQVAQDAPLVEEFYLQHPEARAWFKHGVTLLELAEEAVRRKYGRFVANVHTGGYSSFSKGMEFYDRVFTITIGGKEMEVRFPYVVEEYGDD